MDTYRLTDAAREALAGVLLKIGRDPSNAYILRTLDGKAELTAPMLWLEPVAFTPDEPEPGAYLIGGRLAMRWPGDENGNRWLVADPRFKGEGRGFAMSWPGAVAECGGPGVEIVPLVPATKADTQAECPLPFPGENIAKRLDGGGWSVENGPTPIRVPAESVDGCTEPDPANDWLCSGHLRGWHVADNSWSVLAVWPIR